MKILIVVHQTLPYFIGGVECLTHDYVLALKEVGHQPLVFSQIRNEFEPVAQKTEEYSEYIHEKISSRYSLKNEFANTDILDSFITVLDQFVPDIVHIMHLQYLHYEIAKVVKQRKIPLITSVFDYWFFCRQVQRLYPGGILCNNNLPVRCSGCSTAMRLRHNKGSYLYVFRLMTPIYSILGYVAGEGAHIYKRRIKALESVLNYSDAVCFGTKAMQDFYKKHFSIKNRFLVPYGIHEPDKQISFRGPVDRLLKLGFIGTCAPHKGVQQLIDSFLELHMPDCQLILYLNESRDVDYVRRVKQTAEGMNSIQIRDPFPFEKIYDHLAEFDALVIPSIWDENMPLVLLAALNMHIPVLGSNMAGIVEFIKVGKTGFVFNPDNKNSITQVLELFVDKIRAGWIPDFNNEKIYSIKEYLKLNLELYYKLGDFICAEYVDMQE